MGNTVGDGTTPSQPTEEQLELRLPEEIITKLAFEAQVRDMSIGELVGEVIIGVMKKDLFQQVLKASSKQLETSACVNKSDPRATKL